MSEQRDNKNHGGRSTGPKGITEEQIAQALMNSGGVVAEAARKLKCVRKNLRVRIDNSAYLLEVEVEAQETLIDDAVSAVVHHVRGKDLRAALAVLDRFGRKRGLGRVTEVGGIGGAPIQHAVTTERVDPTTPEEIAAARRRYIDHSDDEGA